MTPGDIQFVENYLLTQSKKLKSFRAIQKAFTAGVDQLLCQSQQFVYGFFVGVANDITVKNTLDGGSFLIYDTSTHNEVFGDKYTSTNDFFVSGYLIDWE